MKTLRIVSLRRKLIWLTVCFGLLHLLWGFSTQEVLLGLENFGKELPSNGSIEWFLVPLQAIAILVASLLVLIINVILFLIFMLVFSKVFYRSVAYGGEAFMRYSRQIMLAMMVGGSLFLLVISFAVFPLSVFAIAYNYTIFSFVLLQIATGKIKKVYTPLISGGEVKP